MKPEVFDVAVVGNVGIDSNVYFPHGEINFTVESNFTENIDYVGQAGGYTSRGFAQLGKKTAFIGYVGDDHNGRFIREEFGRDQIDMSALFIDPAGTSRSINFMSADGRRKNFYDGKSHMQLIPDIEACKFVLKNSRLAHFHLPNWARTLLPIARESGCVISCDIQDVTAPDDPYRHDFVKQADILFFSAVNHSDPEPLMRYFSSINPDQIQICGLGSRGCAILHKGNYATFAPVELSAPVIDTNGAGDGLATGFLTSFILETRTIEDSIMRGQIAARFTCSQKASSSTLITNKLLAEEFERLKKHDAKGYKCTI